MNHELYMQRCLDLAKAGLRNAAPNPSVGAVLVYNNEILSEGHTSPYGGAHAEVNCINNLQEAKRDLLSKSTLYVSLEPCSHFGKTPPCSDLIIKSGIPSVVIATRDSNPLVAGKGIKKLQNAGIQVVENILAEAARDLNKRFFTFHTKHRPYIILKWAETADGIFAPDNKEQFWITNKKTKALVHSWRSEEMAILVGDKTVAIDNPRLNVRLVKGENPIRVVINTQEELDSKLHIFQDGLETIIFSYEIKENTDNVHYLKLNKEENVPEQILTKLYQRNVNSIFIEGGAYTLKQFIANELWDEARILIGSGEIKKGIEAPRIEGKLIEEFNILQDTIKIYRKNL